ncbi:hypothetical protein H4R21_002838, partial [Coemansia helicoidea]
MARVSGSAQSVAREPPGEASRSHTRRGSLWRAKLSFTNTRRPESRQHRHQSFDSNAVDIAAHPRMFPESPLVSLPTAAPATAHPRTSNQRLADTLLEAGVDIAAPHSAAPATSAHQHGLVAGSPDDVGGLAAIDRDFLLTIQRNSALEARRQRRRETRRSTLSYLAATTGGTAPQEWDVLGLQHCPGSDAQGDDGAGDEGSTHRDNHAAGCPSGIGHQFMRASACGTAVRPAPAAPDTTGDGPGPSCAAATASPPRKPRPTSVDYAEGACTHAAGSSGSARSSRDGARPRAAGSPHKLAPSEIGQAVAKETVAQAALASTMTAARPALDAVPPVPPLPNHIAAYSPRQTAYTASSPPERPATARARGSQRQVVDSRRHRGSTSAVPLAPHLPPPLDPASSSEQPLGNLGAQLQEYRMGSVPIRPGAEPHPKDPRVGSDGHATRGAERKHNHPEIQQAPAALPSPMPSPGLFSKSAASLGARISFDNGR